MMPALDPVTVNISDLRRDGGTQMREQINMATAKEYAASIEGGEHLPPIVAFRDADAALWLADGFHRVLAHELIGRAEIDALIHDGERRDAILFSVGANSQHGIRRSRADKRQAIATLLNDAEWSTWSDRAIALRCAVSPTLVAQMRPAADAEGDQVRTYITKHGTPSSMRVGAIGGRASAEPSDPPRQEPSPQTMQIVATLAAALDPGYIPDEEPATVRSADTGCAASTMIGPGSRQLREFLRAYRDGADVHDAAEQAGIPTGEADLHARAEKAGEYRDIVLDAVPPAEDTDEHPDHAALALRLIDTVEGFQDLGTVNAMIEAWGKFRGTGLDEAILNDAATWLVDFAFRYHDAEAHRLAAVSAMLRRIDEDVVR